ncbi:MAG: ABC transporter ATP-binding protein [Candidatus Wallbacteria bacterium]|nr:ABC transporter ATP-binding protein [Candidatus Wallbacteria bacterium]
MNSVLVLEDVTKSYGGRQVLRGISLELAAGQILGYFGLNGAGKSTTNRILLGFARPTAGRCRLLGFDAGDRRALARCGYLPESPHYHDYLTGSEVLEYAACLYGVPHTERARRAAAAAARVVLAPEALGRRVGTYSKGMRQRLGLAQALLHDPAFLLLDEPFTGLDPVGRAMLKELLRQYRSGGGTVFFSSHQLLDAQEICDRAAILHQGRLVADASLSELEASHPGLTLEQIFLRHVGGDAESDRD